jgi:hypothetical protein
MSICCASRGDEKLFPSFYSFQFASPPTTTSPDLSSFQAVSEKKKTQSQTSVQERRENDERRKVDDEVTKQKQKQG